jgi:Xaa-Pro aminopeptidase
METMQGALKNGRNVWENINMPQSEFDSRVAKIRECMKKEKIDILLIYGYAFNQYGNTAYMTNFITRLPRGALVAVPAKGQTALFFDGSSRGIPSMRRTVCNADVVAVSDMPRDCVKYLKEKNLLPSRIGFAGVREMMPYQQHASLCELLSDSTLIDASSIITEMRFIKSERELDEIRRAARIVKDVLDRTPAFPFPAFKEQVIQAFLYREARFWGAEDVRLFLGRTRPEGWYLGPAEDEIIGQGQIVVFCFAVEFERYWAEATRTFKVEGDLLVPVGHEVDELFHTVIEKIKPGATVSAVYRSAVEGLNAKGLEPMLEYGIGQGIGLSADEPPCLGEGEDALVREGMALALRLFVKDPSAGAVATGSTVIVTAAATEVLT